MSFAWFLQNPKLCGFYRFPKDYLDELITLGVIVIKQQQLSEDEELAGSVEDEQHNDLEKKLANLTFKMNCLLVVLVVFVVVTVVRSFAKP